MTATDTETQATRLLHVLHHKTMSKTPTIVTTAITPNGLELTVEVHARRSTTSALACREQAQTLPTTQTTTETDTVTQITLLMLATDNNQQATSATPMTVMTLSVVGTLELNAPPAVAASPTSTRPVAAQPTTTIRMASAPVLTYAKVPMTTSTSTTTENQIASRIAVPQARLTLQNPL